jgi:Fe2+ or Zn2+ uptake regulation protein
METYLRKLKEHRLKLTPRRKAVISLFLDSQSCLGPYDVHRILKHKIKPLGIPTTYRILEELCSIGVLARIQSRDRHLYYTLCSIPESHHHHFICRKCKRIKEVEYCNFKGVSSFIEKKMNCKVESHLIQIEGLCARCR